MSYKGKGGKLAIPNGELKNERGEDMDIKGARKKGVQGRCSLSIVTVASSSNQLLSTVEWGRRRKRKRDFRAGGEERRNPHAVETGRRSSLAPGQRTSSHDLANRYNRVKCMRRRKKGERKDMENMKKRGEVVHESSR